MQQEKSVVEDTTYTSTPLLQLSQNKSWKTIPPPHKHAFSCRFQAAQNILQEHS